jgi:hypothetical protein
MCWPPCKNIQLIDILSLFFITSEKKSIKKTQLLYSVLQYGDDLNVSDIEMDGEDHSAWMSEEDLSRQASSYITENTEDSLAFDNRVNILV